MVAVDMSFMSTSTGIETPISYMQPSSPGAETPNVLWEMEVWRGAGAEHVVGNAWAGREWAEHTRLSHRVWSAWSVWEAQCT